MGSPFRPTFANIFMCELEQNFLSNNKQDRIFKFCHIYFILSSVFKASFLFEIKDSNISVLISGDSSMDQI